MQRLVSIVVVTLYNSLNLVLCLTQCFHVVYVRHGIRQLRSGWSDGPAYITQCPIQPGQNYVYNFTITGQRGTLFWHAHILWLRATMHGALVILPKLRVPYPFPKPDHEAVIILGEHNLITIQYFLFFA